MENEQIKAKTSKGLIALIVILIIMVLGLSSYIIYDKMLVKNGNLENNNEENLNIGESNENVKTLSGNIYYFDKSKEHYINFISDTEYEYYSYGTSIKGTYGYSDNKVVLNENNETVILDDDLSYIYIYDTDEGCYKIYFNGNIIDEELKKIENAAAIARLNYWNSNNETKMTKVEAGVSACYSYDTSSGDIVCGANFKQYFDNYNQDTCINDDSSDFYTSKISSGGCESSYSTNWYFAGLHRNSNGYTGVEDSGASAL
jgi:hypothetical protein